jgi:hypothetical protein
MDSREEVLVRNPGRNWRKFETMVEGLEESERPIKEGSIRKSV